MGGEGDILFCGFAFGVFIPLQYISDCSLFNHLSVFLDCSLPITSLLFITMFSELSTGTYKGLSRYLWYDYDTFPESLTLAASFFTSLSVSEFNQRSGATTDT